MRVAIGLRARIGRAALVIVGGEAKAPVFVESREVKLLPDGDWAPYHAAAELPRAKQHESVDRAIATAHRLAEEALRDAKGRCTAAGHDAAGCGVLMGRGMPAWTTDEILAVHVRMHVAEGELFRNVLVAGARANALPVATLPGKSALEAAAKALGMKPAQLEASLAALGKAAGPPWRKEQREAAAAALVALAGAKAGRR
jgi:hypothetical protein